MQRAGDEQFELWIRIHAETHAAGGVGDLDHRLQSVVVVRHRPLVPEAVAADTLFKLVLHSASHGQHSLDHRRVVEYRGDTDQASVVPSLVVVDGLIETQQRDGGGAEEILLDVLSLDVAPYIGETGQVVSLG